METAPHGRAASRAPGADAGYALGVDLGTTYAAAAVYRQGRAEVVTLGFRSSVVPAVVYVAPDGSLLTGDAALRRGATDPARLAREFKRRIGDQVPIIVGGSPMSAEALSARLLRSIVDSVAEQQGGPPGAVAVTRPANWGPFKQDRFRQVLELADLPDAIELSEPEAAAITYATDERVEPGAVVAVYDLGGGTFDATVLRRTPDGFELLGEPGGIEQLGGIDLDAAVVARVLEAVANAVDQLDDEDPGAQRAMARLRLDCIDAKEALSSDSQVSIPVTLPNLSTEVRLTRAEFEDMARPALVDTVGALRRAIASAQVEPDDIDRVLLVGGSSRVPLVAALVTQALGRPVVLDAHPKHVVARGAAVVAARALAAAAPTPPEPVDVGITPALPVEPTGSAPSGTEDTPQTTTPEPVAVPGPAARAPVEPNRHALPVEHRRRRRAVLVAGAVVAVAAGAAVLVGVVGGDDPAPADPASSEPPSSVTPALVTLSLGQPIAVPARPDGIAVVPDGLWVASTGADAVTLVDPTGGAATQAVALGPEPLAVASAFDSIWVTVRNGGTTVRLDPATGEQQAVLETPGRPAAFGIGADSLWVVSADGAVNRVDPATNTVVATIDVTTPAGLAVSDDAVWASSYETATVVKIDPATNTIIDSLAVGANPDAMALSPDFLWVTNRGDGTLSRIDLASGATHVVEVGTAPAGIAIDGDRVWVIDNEDGTLVLVDGPTGVVVDSIAVGSHPLGLAVTPDVVWVTLNGDDAIVPVSVN